MPLSSTELGKEKRVGDRPERNYKVKPKSVETKRP